MRHRTYPLPKSLPGAWGDSLALDHLEVLALMPDAQPETSAWAQRVLDGAYKATPDPAPVPGILTEDGEIIGVLDKDGTTYGSDAGQPVPLTLADYRFCHRAFAEGASSVLPMPDLPVGFAAAASITAGAAPAFDVPSGSAELFAETARDGSPFILNVFAVDQQQLQCWVRSGGTWHESPEFLNVLGTTSPRNAVARLDEATAAQFVWQADLATSGIADPMLAALVAAAETEQAPFCGPLVPLVARGNAGTLRRYWEVGEGAAKIRWGTGGDWYRCYRHLKKYMGVRAKGYCFSGDTCFTTRDGVMTFAEAVGTTQFVLTASASVGSRVIDGPIRDGYWVEAEILPFGEQRLLTVTLQRGGVQKVVRATPEHRWFVSPNGRNIRRNDLLQVTTEELQPGMVLPSAHVKQRERHLSPDGVRAGLVYGDGAAHSKSTAVLDLWGEKQDLLRFFDGYNKGTEKQLDSGILGTRIYGLPIAYKSAPAFNSDLDYLYGWLAGYFAADGSVSGGVVLSSARRESLEHAKHVATLLGIDTGSITSQWRKGYGHEATELFTMSFAKWSLSPEFFLKNSHREAFGVAATKTSGRWKVVSVEDHGEVEPVYCAVVPGTEQFVLTEGILTRNCAKMHKRMTGMHTGDKAHRKMYGWGIGDLNLPG